METIRCAKDFFYSAQALLLAINKWNIEFVIDWGEGFRVCNSDFFSDAILWKCSKRKLLLLLSVWGRIYNHIMYKAGPLLLFKKHYTWPALQFQLNYFTSVTQHPEINRCLGNYSQITLVMTSDNCCSVLLKILIIGWQKNMCGTFKTN